MEQTTFRIAIDARDTAFDHSGAGFVQAARESGLTGLSDCARARLYFLQGTLTPADAARVARELLTDPVTEQFTVSVGAGEQAQRPMAAVHTIEVTPLPGVTDPAAENLVRAARALGIDGVARAATGQRFTLTGTLDTDTLTRLASELFANPVVHRFAIDRPIAPPFFAYQAADERVDVIPLRMADDAELMAISAARRLALNLAEMQAIRAYFAAEGRDPTDVELEMLAQTWSEHCVHKTFKATIDYVGPPAGASPTDPPRPQRIDGLLRTYIQGATETINKPWVRSAFVDNAGIIAFTDTHDLAFKVETHNHPSALEPFGGANTGVGGVVRDILGVSARPIANTDILCFGPPDLAHDDLPVGVLHPRRIAAGVVRGIEDYGNKMGIPTVNGAILYHPGYTANPLVYCGCLGVLPRGAHRTQAQPGDLIVAIGGRTGRDGLRGATFSSMEMDVATSEIAGTAVQIGHPIQEKQVQEVVLRARDEGLYNAITDCGAGGFSSAVGEMGEKIGARVQLQAATLKYPGLRPWEIWLSEAQERMVLAVPPRHLQRLRQICAGQNVEPICLGEFEPGGRLRLFFGERLVGDVSMAFLHDGLPRRIMPAFWPPPTRQNNTPPPKADPANWTTTLLDLLAHPDIHSKEDVIRRYDHEVQGGTAIKPLVGSANAGPADAAVLVPQSAQVALLDAPEAATVPGVALGNGIRPGYTARDPYLMAWAAIDEALRNVVAVGADPDRVAILDNFCWGNPNLPDRLGGLVRCAQGCHDAAIAYGTPFISGKDSLNNEYTGADGQKHAIPGTLLISALGIVPDVTRTTATDLRQPGSRLYVIGDTREELGGGHYAALRHAADGQLPQPVPDAPARLRALHQAIRAGLVQACHDCADGGLAVTLAEMALAGGLGLDVDVARLPVAYPVTTEAALFAESLTRFVLEVAVADMPALEAMLADIPHAVIGKVTAATRFILRDGEQPLIDLSVTDLERAWRGQESPPPPVRATAPLPSARQRGGGHRVGAARVLILHANGTNRDRDAALACHLAGGDPEIVHVNQLLARERRLDDYHMLVVPGGFSYGDDLGAGVLWAQDLRHSLGEALHHFVQSGRPVLGICNGFQVLVKAGVLPGNTSGARDVTLTFNESAQFECRWVYLRPHAACNNLFTRGLDELIYCPVAHGEGRLAVRDEAAAARLWAQNLVALRYVDAAGNDVGYPGNPNGSVDGIAGLSNAAGNVLGLMPHPENHIFPWQCPRGEWGGEARMGLRLFVNGLRGS